MLGGLGRPAKHARRGKGCDMLARAAVPQLDPGLRMSIQLKASTLKLRAQLWARPITHTEQAEDTCKSSVRTKLVQGGG
jgi:hypothetical protein